MPYYRRVGEVPRKRHTVHRGPDGGRYSEELMGEQGFSAASTLLYHRFSPSAITSVSLASGPRPCLSPNQPLSPHHFRTPMLEAGADMVMGRTLLFGNDDIAVCWVSTTSTSPLYRNATGDEVVYLHDGVATLQSTFGQLDVRAGDYAVIPASTTHRWVLDGPVQALVLEARHHVATPRRYLTPEGQFLEQSPYCERDLRAPDSPLIDEATDVEVLVRTGAGLTAHVHAHHPFDVVGWDGCVYPYALSIHDFEPIVGSLHQPPPVHQTFEGNGFVICSFVPRPFDFHPDAVKVPYHHANVDSDEVLFYSAGSFMSRAGSGIGAGSISLHPAGFVHGPQPGSWERSIDQDRTDELAVMLDTFRPLLLSDAARSISDPAYPTSWSRG